MVLNYFKIQPIPIFLNTLTFWRKEWNSYRLWNRAARYQLATILCTADSGALYHELTCSEQPKRFAEDSTQCTQHQYHALWQWDSKQPVFVIDKPCDSEINGICIRHRICIESDAVEPIPLIALPQLRVNESLSGARALNNKELT